MDSSKLLNHLYEKWVVQASEAYYHGCGEGADDFKKLFKMLKYKSTRKARKAARKAV
jgi:hypothetical protein